MGLLVLRSRGLWCTSLGSGFSVRRVYRIEDLQLRSLGFGLLEEREHAGRTRF